MIKWDDEYQSTVEELRVGDTARVDHEGCSAGADTRQRLYLTKVDDSKVVCYCHNCQNGGYFRVGESYRRAHSAMSMTELKDKEFEVPRINTDPNTWPRAASTLVFAAGLAVPRLYNIGYHVETEALFLPMYSIMREGEERTIDLMDLKGYQLRPVNKVGSKYVTVMKDSDADMSTLYHCTGYDSLQSIVVVVEDLLSGIKVGRTMHLMKQDGVVLINYGTKVNLEAINQALKICNGTHLAVWFDNDSPHVIKQAHTIARTASLMSTGLKATALEPEHTHHKKDPKRLPMPLIRGNLEEVLHGHG